MKITLEIPKEFECDFTEDRFNDFFRRVMADMECLCGRYEHETAVMFNDAFKKAIVQADD